MHFFAAGWLAAVNLIGAGAAFADKWRAKHDAWRIPERTLFLLCVLGGCPGVYLAMRLCRHKTQHKRFMWGIPAIFAAQLILLAVIFYHLHDRGGL